MKKLFCVFLALSVMLFAFPFSVSAASGISVETVNTYLQAGETVYLDITFSVGKYVQAFEFTVTYDPDVLTFKEASDGIYNNYEPGKIKYVDVGSGSTDTVTFAFRTKAAGEASVSFTEVAAADIDEYSFPDFTYNFTVDKATRGDVDGNGNINATDLAALKLYLAGSILSVSDYADYNKDSLVDATDLAALKQYLAEG